jgi:hypothetical protein
LAFGSSGTGTASASGAAAFAARLAFLILGGGSVALLVSDYADRLDCWLLLLLPDCTEDIDYSNYSTGCSFAFFVLMRSLGFLSSIFIKFINFEI